MARFLVYTSPARGHLFPTVPTLLELQRKGHEVSVVTLREEVPRLAAAGLRARAMDERVEAIALDDHAAGSPPAALQRALTTWAKRGEHEVADLKRAIAEERPDALWVDFNSWGACAVAETSGLPWAIFMPYFLPWSLPGIPPFGPGLAPRRDLLGRVRDAVVGRLSRSFFAKGLAGCNAVRSLAGAPPLASMDELGRAAPLLIHFTAEPFEYACPERPRSVVQVGPALWEPESATPEWLASVDRPLVLVTASTEFQADARLLSATLEVLANEPVFVVATTGANDPAQLPRPANARVERYAPHGPLLARAACVVCHGGMGVTQKALAAGVPVCVVPFGRDQNEVARHVEVAQAGTTLAPGRLTAERLRAAVALARTRTAGAQRIAEAFRAAGGPARAAHALEGLIAPSVTARAG